MASKTRAELLDKVSRPTRKPAEEEVDRDLAELEGEDELMAEGEDQLPEEELALEEEGEMMAPLEDVSDEDLLAEAVRRGLLEGAEEDMEEMPEEEPV